ARVFGLDRHLHLHRLEDRHRVALLDRVADRALYFPDRTGDVSFDLDHAFDNSLPRRSTMPGETFVILTAYNEADRIGATLAALALAFPGATVWVADDGSTDSTPRIAREAGARVVRSERVIGKGEAATPAALAALGGGLAHPAGAGQRAVSILCDGDLGESAAELAALAEPIGAARRTWRWRPSPAAWEAGSGSRSRARAWRSAGGAGCAPRRRSPDSARCAGARSWTCSPSPTASGWRGGGRSTPSGRGIASPGWSWG